MKGERIICPMEKIFKPSPDPTSNLVAEEEVLRGFLIEVAHGYNWTTTSL